MIRFNLIMTRVHQDQKTKQYYRTGCNTGAPQTLTNYLNQENDGTRARNTCLFTRDAALVVKKLFRVLMTCLVYSQSGVCAPERGLLEESSV